MITALFDVGSDFLNPIAKVLWPNNAFNIVLDIVIAVGLVFALFAIIYYRRPSDRPIARYKFSTAEHMFQGMLYHYPDARSPDQLQVLAQLPEAANIADLMLKSNDDLYFYILEIESMQDATLEHGRAIVMTHDQMEDIHSYRPRGSHFNVFKGGRVYLREANEAMPQARVYLNEGLFDDKPCHLIYYPMVPRDLIKQPTIIQYDKEILGTVASLRQTTKYVKVVKELESRVAATENKYRDLLRQNTSLSGEVQEFSAIASLPPYDSKTEVQHTPSISPWVAAGILFMSIFGTIQFMQNQYPSTPISNSLFLGAIIGFVGIFIVNHFYGSKRATQAKTTPLTG